MWILTRPRCSKALLKPCAFGCASRSRASDRAIEHPVSLHLVERQCELALCAPSTERCCLFLHLLHFPPLARVNHKIDVSWSCFREVHREGTSVQQLRTIHGVTFEMPTPRDAMNRNVAFFGPRSTKTKFSLKGIRPGEREREKSDNFTGSQTAGQRLFYLRFRGIRIFYNRETHGSVHRLG